jgi:hypothetical protein
MPRGGINILTRRNLCKLIIYNNNNIRVKSVKPQNMKEKHTCPFRAPRPRQCALLEIALSRIRILGEALDSFPRHEGVYPALMAT